MLEPGTLGKVQELLGEVPRESLEGSEGEDKEENEALDKMSNVKWLMYPFKKSVVFVVNKITGRNIKAY